MPRDYAKRLSDNKRFPWLTITLLSFILCFGLYEGYQYMQKQGSKGPKKASIIKTKADVIHLPSVLWQSTLHGGYFFIGGNENINGQAVAQTKEHSFYGPYTTLNQAIGAYNALIQSSSTSLKIQFVPAQFPKQQYYTSE